MRCAGNDLPSLKLRRYQPDGKGYVRPAQYFIYDDDQQHYLGLGEADSAAAQGELRAYIARQHAEGLASPKKRSKATPASEKLLEDVIAYYMLDTAPRFEIDPDAEPGAVRRAKRQRQLFLDRMEWLLDYWTGKTVDDIDKATCAEFSKRHSPSTARRCLEDLRAAVNVNIKNRQLAKDGEHVFDLPRANPPRYGFFTCNQMARLLWAAYRKKGAYTHSSKRSSGEKVGVTKTTDLRPMRHISRFLLVAVYTGTRTDRIEQASFYPEPGRPWVDVDGGIFYRSWDGERVPDNKRANPVRIPVRLLSHLRRWKKNGARYVIEYRGRPVGTASAFFRLLRETLPKEERKAHRLNRHACKHTCATWLMQAGEPLSDVAGFLATDEKTIVRHYGHHHPDYQAGISRAFSSGAGKIGTRRDTARQFPQRATADSSAALAAEVRRAIRDLLELAAAPVTAFGVIDTTPDAGLEALRETMKRCARSGDWSALLGENAA
ncbi:MAG: integrase [Mesorhizobium sp.]|nr:integrase [Mesorhizobium sp.]